MDRGNMMVRVNNLQYFRGTRGNRLLLGSIFLLSFMTLQHGNRMIAWRSVTKVDKAFYSNLNLTRARAQERRNWAHLSFVFVAFSFWILAFFHINRHANCPQLNAGKLNANERSNVQSDIIRPTFSVLSRLVS